MPEDWACTFEVKAKSAQQTAPASVMLADVFNESEPLFNVRASIFVDDLSDC